MLLLTLVDAVMRCTLSYFISRQQSILSNTYKLSVGIILRYLIFLFLNIMRRSINQTQVRNSVQYVTYNKRKLKGCKDHRSTIDCGVLSYRIQSLVILSLTGVDITIKKVRSLNDMDTRIAIK
jgi:uncharacterized membrane protein YjgN (DUF898 family)